MRRIALATAAFGLAALSCAGPGASGARAAPAGLDEATARAVLALFADALLARDLERAHGLLSARWRAVSSPARLARDLDGASALAAEAAARARRGASSAPVELSPGRARVLLGEGRVAVLLAEDGAWRVDALE